MYIQYLLEENYLNKGTKIRLQKNKKNNEVDE